MKLSIRALIFVVSTSSHVIEAAATTSHDETISSILHPMTPNPNPYEVTYEDGTKSPPLRIKVRGKITESPEIYEETTDGFTVKPVKGSKYYTYLDVNDVTGDLIETGFILGIDNPFTSNVRKDAAKRSREIKKKKDKDKKGKGKGDSARNLFGKNEEHRRTAITSGTLKNLVIPFKFYDHTSRSLPSRSELDTFMNNVGADADVCPTGSVRDVYQQNSFDQLDLQSTVIDWVTLDFTYTESYCANSASGLSTKTHECLVNALSKAVAAGVDFGDYDLDNDGLIDGITFFHSGYAAEWGGTDSYGASTSDRMWSHKWAIYTQNWSNNGVRVYEYHINPSLWSTSGSNIGRIGVVAHETGHFLGLPDLYDYGDDTYGDGAGIGSYGLMANSWGFDGSQYYPPLMSAWSKYKLGWVTPRTISTSGSSYSLDEACDNDDVIMINEGYPSGEYLLIENRQSCGFDSSMSQGGLAIFHIDDNANNIRGYPGQIGWPTNGNHYEVALLQADGGYGLEKNSNRGDSSDVFHAASVNSIGPNGLSSGASYPNTKAYQNGIVIDTGVTISNISASGSTMTFDITFPTSSPTASPNASPTVSPTVSPTLSPTASPTSSLTVNPTVSPTASPTDSPTGSPTISPTVSPTASSTRSPTASPTKSPTANPTAAPTASPTMFPTTSLTTSPTALGTTSSTLSPAPTKSPTKSPTAAPTTNPTAAPTVSPTTSPSVLPTASITSAPTTSPTVLPTASSTASPTARPTTLPTTSPSIAPTASLSTAPTASPTANPTSSPTMSPTASPTAYLTMSPTASPTASPTTSAAPTATCNDSDFPFKVRVNKTWRTEDCTWVASNIPVNCAINGISASCPSTCGTCATCEDSSLRFRLPNKNGKFGFRRCAWVSEQNYCAMTRVRDTCRKVCGSC